jgi:hypothetical protein
MRGGADAPRLERDVYSSPLDVTRVNDSRWSTRGQLVEGTVEVQVVDVLEAKQKSQNPPPSKPRPAALGSGVTGRKRTDTSWCVDRRPPASYYHQGLSTP